MAFACLYGFSASSYVSLFPAALAEQSRIQNFASISGLLYMIRGIDILEGMCKRLLKKRVPHLTRPMGAHYFEFIDMCLR